MKVSEFLNLLENNSDKETRFAYSAGKYAKASYHLTEVKNVTFDTTDCGGKTNHWQETHIQLWESPAEEGKTTYMTAGKLLAILNRVDGIKALWPETAIKVEYGNQELNTGVMPVKGARADNTHLDFLLFEEAALCKARIARDPEEDQTETVERECGQVASCC